MAIDKKKRFKEAIENNKGIVYKVANSYCRSNANLEDLIQEILIQVWLSFDSYNEAYKFSTWLYKVAFNVAISFDRREQHSSRPIRTQMDKVAIQWYRMESGN